jgi:hypothetical protein
MCNSPPPSWAPARNHKKLRVGRKRGKATVGHADQDLTTVKAQRAAVRQSVDRICGPRIKSGYAYMAVLKPAKADWRPFFDRISRSLTGRRAEIAIVTPMDGEQIEAEWVPLLGISYDPKNDVIDIILDGLDHRIAQPQSVISEERGRELYSLEIVDRDGVSQSVLVRER